MKAEETGARKALYSMSEACEKTGLPYETLKFYCNKGLVPNVKRTGSNYRVFDDNDIGWIGSLRCLRKCGMSIEEMQRYKDLCMEGTRSIPERRKILAEKLELLKKERAEIQESIDYIEWKNGFYDDVEAGRIEYVSYLLPGAETDDR